MPRPLFGFRQVKGRIVPVTDELAVVRAVLHAKRGQLLQAARRATDVSVKATMDRMQRIQRHRAQYLRGEVLLGLPPNRELAALVTADA